MSDVTKRFSNRADHYAKYRPSYPAALFDFLFGENIIRPQDAVGDIGSGTGIFSKLLLERGATVYGVEPNGPMRASAEAQLAGFPNFISVDGRAEATQLPDQCLDAVVCAQAFHWFDPVATRQEFMRVAKPQAPIIVVWNNRSVDVDAFAKDYEQLLLDHGIGYERVKNSWAVPAAVWRDFFPQGHHLHRFGIVQTFDWEGLLGRALSASYVPDEQNPAFPDFERRLRTVYDKHQRDGIVSFTYDTDAYIGVL